MLETRPEKGFKVGVYCRIPSDHLFPWKIIWGLKVGSRVALSIWAATLDKILTIKNLR